MKWEPNIENITNTAKTKSSVSLAFFEKQGAEFKESVSLKNNTSQTIKNNKGLLLYYDMNRNPISYQYDVLDDLLMPGMAKLREFRSFDQNQKFVYAYGKDNDCAKATYSQFFVEFKLLDYVVVETDFMDKIIGN